MTKRKHEARIRLRDASNTLSEEVWEGNWDSARIRLLTVAEESGVFSKRFLTPLFFSGNEYGNDDATGIFQRYRLTLLK